MNLLSAREKNESVRDFVTGLDGRCSSREGTSAQPADVEPGVGPSLLGSRLDHTAVRVATLALASATSFAGLFGCSGASSARNRPRPPGSDRGASTVTAQRVIDTRGAQAPSYQHPRRPSTASPEVGRVPVAQRRKLPGQGLSIVLPMSVDYKEAQAYGSWAQIVGPATAPRLWIAHRPARRTVTVDECESDARLSLSLLRHGLGADHERPWLAGDGYAGRLKIVFFEDGHALVEGFAVALSRCLALAVEVPASPLFAEQLREVVLEVAGGIRLLKRTPAGPAARATDE